MFCSLYRCGSVVFQIRWIGHSLFWFVMQRALVFFFYQIDQITRI
jgi:hypothetical protein